MERRGKDGKATDNNRVRKCALHAG